VAADGVVAAGWRGADPDPDLRGFHDAGPGPVTALLGYLLAVRTEAAVAAGGLPAAARFYRNADLEFSLRLGQAGALVVPAGPLPVRQARHRGYHDSDPQVRDRESRRNYRRVLELLSAAAG
jgi:GT2 family glycosyltransferase